MTTMHNYLILETSEFCNYYDDVEYKRSIAELEDGQYILRLTEEQAQNITRFMRGNGKYSDLRLMRLIAPETPDKVDMNAIMRGTEEMLRKELEQEQRKKARVVEDAEKRRLKQIEREAKKLAKDPVLLAAVMQQMEGKV